jgi:hypothetical protein
MNSTIIDASRPILAACLPSIPAVGQPIRRPLLITRPKVLTLAPCKGLEASAKTAKETSASPKSYATQFDEVAGSPQGPKPAKLGRWTPEEKQRFIDGKYLSKTDDFQIYIITNFGQKFHKIPKFKFEG